MAKDEEADKKGQLTNKIPTGSNHSSHYSKIVHFMLNDKFKIIWTLMMMMLLSLIHCSKLGL